MAHDKKNHRIPRRYALLVGGLATALGLGVLGGVAMFDYSGIVNEKEQVETTLTQFQQNDATYQEQIKAYLESERAQEFIKTHYPKLDLTEQKALPSESFRAGDGEGYRETFMRPLTRMFPATGKLDEKLGELDRLYEANIDNELKAFSYGNTEALCYDLQSVKSADDIDLFTAYDAAGHLENLKVSMDFCGVKDDALAQALHERADEVLGQDHAGHAH